MNPGSLSPDQAFAALGARDAADALQVGLRRHAKEALADADRLLLPDDTSRAEAAIARAEARLVADLDAEHAARDACDAIKSVIDEKEAALRTAELGAGMAASSYDEALACEREAFERGDTEVAVDVDAARVAAEAGKRRVAVVRDQLAQASAPLEQAQARLDAASDRRRSAEFHLARARLAAAAAEACRSFVDEVKPLLAATDVAARAGFTDGVAAVRSLNGIRDAIAYALEPVLPAQALRALPAAPRRAAAAIVAAAAEADDETLVELVVAPGENYAGARAGTRVRVSEAEAEQQLRCDPRTGRRLGALMTVDEHERQSAAQAERERPKFTKSPIVEAVERGLATIAEVALGKRAEQAAAEERRRRSEEGLARLVEHQLATAATPTPEERAMRVVLEQQGDND